VLSCRSLLDCERKQWLRSRTVPPTDHQVVAEAV
jgi:hypothetical protein